MKTQILANNEKNIKIASELLKKGEIVGIPTETVYGLAANALCEQAVDKIFLAKGRPQDNPLIVHISNLEMLNQLVEFVPKKAQILICEFWPAPLTIIMPKSKKVPYKTTANLETVAVRMPNNKIALDIINQCGLPLAAPSANNSGKPSPTTAKHVYDDMNGKIPVIIDGGDCELGIESTVVLVQNDKVVLLRPGGITENQLKQVVGDIEISPGVSNPIDENQKVQSPGLKHKHYSPVAQVYIVKSSLEQFENFVNNINEYIHCLVFDGEKTKINKPCLTYGCIKKPQQQAKNLFKKLREFDEINAKKVYVRFPDINGIGLGVYNRLLRAAEFRVIEL